MNDIIKQFEKQCWNHQAWQLDAEKFAELIVRQCAEICLEANDHDNILRYFGVKE